MQTPKERKVFWWKWNSIFGKLDYVFAWLNMSLTWLNPARIESVTEPVPTLPLPLEVPSNKASPPLNIFEVRKVFLPFPIHLCVKLGAFSWPSHGKGLQPYGVSESQAQLKNKPRLLRFPDYKRKRKESLSDRIDRLILSPSSFGFLLLLLLLCQFRFSPSASLKGGALFFFGGGSCFRFLLQQVGGRGWKGFKSSAAAAGEPSPPTSAQINRTKQSTEEPALLSWE